jgi:hypothetical protein
MLFQKHSKTTSTETKEGQWKRESFFRTSTIGCSDISMEISGYFFWNF